VPQITLITTRLPATNIHDTLTVRLSRLNEDITTMPCQIRRRCLHCRLDDATTPIVVLKTMPYALISMPVSDVELFERAKDA